MSDAMRFEKKLRGWKTLNHIIVRRSAGADELDREYRDDEVGGFEVDEGDVINASALIPFGLRPENVTRVRYVAESALLVDSVEAPDDSSYDIFAVPCAAVVMVM